MYTDSDSEDDSYPPVSSTGYPRGETVLSNSQRKGVTCSSTQGGHYIRPAQFQVRSEVHLGISQGSVRRCS